MSVPREVGTLQVAALFPVLHSGLRSGQRPPRCSMPVPWYPQSPLPPPSAPEWGPGRRVTPSVAARPSAAAVRMHRIVQAWSPGAR